MQTDTDDCPKEKPARTRKRSRIRAVLVGSTLITTIVAAVIGADWFGSLGSTVYNKLFRDHSILSFSFQQASGQGVTILVTNDGERPGSVGDVDLEQYRGRDYTIFYLAPNGSPPFVPVPVNAHNHVFLNLHTIGGGLKQQAEETTTAKCTLRVNVINSDGSKEEQLKDIPCEQLTMFFVTHSGNLHEVVVSRKPYPFH